MLLMDRISGLILSKTLRNHFILLLIKYFAQVAPELFVLGL